PGVDKYQNVWMVSASSTKQGPIGISLMGKYAAGTEYAPKKILNGTLQLDGNSPLRFGDYASAAQDPVDGSLWLIQMYGGTKPNTEGSNAGCRAVHVTPH